MLTFSTFRKTCAFECDSRWADTDTAILTFTIDSEKLDDSCSNFDMRFNMISLFNLLLKKWIMQSY